ncbi:hypothetical protein Thpro_022970 [Acidihalobacter prosperus]|uniref:Uncharacterized protein n=1 Tax=Acidihalobacter prosperus TaxID=160660 RepID=A0A1A6C2E5_9GAMM|nr:hypothetical protein Thpro_022970 [Acidihalobacter prosperus]
MPGGIPRRGKFCAIYGGLAPWRAIAADSMTRACDVFI